jgi:membrane fusion protein, heavy metal efflux system
VSSTRIVRHLLLVCALGVGACSTPGVQAEKTANPGRGELRLSTALINSGQVRLDPVTATAEAVTVRTSGKAAFDEEHLSYVSSPLVGRVVDIRARPGEHVEAGAPLAVLDSPDLGMASSEFIKARADLILAERTYTLAHELLSAKAMARKEYQKAEDEFVKAQADLRRTRERLLSLGVPAAELDVPLDALHVRAQFTLTAPISGTVIERTLTLGQMVGGEAAQRLYVIADLTTLWVLADIYEKDLALIRPDQDVTVDAAAWPDQHFHGRIGHVGDTVDPNSRTIKVRVTVDNRQRLLKPEMFVTATVHTASNVTVLTVPLAAVHGEGSAQPFVFVAADDTAVARRPVTLGPKEDDRVVIAAGLTPTDRVVTQGSILLKAEADRAANS